MLVQLGNSCDASCSRSHITFPAVPQMSNGLWVMPWVVGDATLRGFIFLCDSAKSKVWGDRKAFAEYSKCIMSRVVRTPMRSTEVNIHPSAIVLCPTGRFRAKRRSADNSSCMKMHEIDRFWKFHSIVTFQPYYRLDHPLTLSHLLHCFS